MPLHIVTGIPSDDATMPPQARQVIRQYYPSMNLLPRYTCRQKPTNFVHVLTFFSAKSVTVLGKEFRSGAMVCVIPPSSMECPMFGEISYIFVPSDIKQFLILLYHTKAYSSHYNAYQVTKTQDYDLISVNQLGVHEVYHKYFVASNIYIVMKSYHHIEHDI